MSRQVKCVVLGVEAEGLDYAPYPGELGQRIYENVSKQGWQRWLAHQTMLVGEMEKFFFGSGSQKPQAFVPKDE
jgi:Fe-S cluster biosynthesis and repair protein YggX